jgi:hypothetical protein
MIEEGATFNKPSYFDDKVEELKKRIATSNIKMNGTAKRIAPTSF